MARYIAETGSVPYPRRHESEVHRSGTGDSIGEQTACHSVDDLDGMYDVEVSSGLGTDLQATEHSEPHAPHFADYSSTHAIRCRRSDEPLQRGSRLVEEMGYKNSSDFVSPGRTRR